MPAVLTHDFFGQDIYGQMSDVIGSSQEEYFAFLLGNQGPDPLFYLAANPKYAAHCKLSSQMHREKPAELLYALKQAVRILPPQEEALGCAYALGFLCHYLLDSTLHPLIYFNQYNLCDAGEPGLTRDNGHEVHALIESELDEMMLYTRTGKTVADFSPQTEVLRIDTEALGVISKMYVFIALQTYGKVIPQELFEESIYSFQIGLWFFHSKTGLKRTILSALEETLRPYSMYRALSHRPIELTQSIYENRSHDLWQNPFTEKYSLESFSNLMEKAQQKAKRALVLFTGEHFDLSSSRNITEEINFLGAPVVPTLVAVEDA